MTAAGAALLSLGPRIRLPLTDLTWPGPWALFADLPLFESVIEGRVAMICAPALGMLLAVALTRMAHLGAPGPAGPAWRASRWLCCRWSRRR